MADLNALQERLQKANPANPAPKTVVELDRVPMNIPTQKLSAPDIPGYHTHWFLGTPDRIHQALRASYQFVEDWEIGISNKDLAGGDRVAAGTDMGTRVSVAAGGTYEGNPSEVARLYLMKLPLELWEKDQVALAAVNEKIAATLRGERKIAFDAPGADNTNRYRPANELNRKKTLFHPKN